MTVAPPAEKTKQKSKPRSARSLKKAERAVRKESKSSAPIFFKKTIVRVIKKYAPEGTRVTPGAIRLVGAILEQKGMKFARKAYTVSRMLRGEEGVVRALRKDAELAMQLSV